jgi:hypothetical protein
VAVTLQSGGTPSRGTSPSSLGRVSDAPQGPGWWQASDGRWYPPESAPPPTQPAPPAGQPPGPYTPYGYPAPAPTSSRATTALVLGLVSVFMCGFLTGIPAMVVGSRARKEITASQGRESGEGLATAGVVLGAIGTAISAIGTLAVAALIVAGALAGSSDTNVRFDDWNGINTDPPDGVCDYDRFMQDPDC